MKMIFLFCVALIAAYIYWAIESFQELFKQAGWIVTETKLVFDDFGIREDLKNVTRQGYLPLWLKIVTPHYRVFNYCGGMADIYVRILPKLFIMMECYWDF